MKVKVEFCDYWFKTQDGKTMYKLYFHLDDTVTVYVPSDKAVAAGSEVVLRLTRGKDGRCAISVAN